MWATGLVDDADTHYGVVTFVGIDELAAASTTRLAVHWPGRSGRELSEALFHSAIPDVQCCCYTDEPLADLTAAGVTKAAMLERLRVQLGVAASETLAVGDGVNDIEMLTWAAHGRGHGQLSSFGAGGSRRSLPFGRRRRFGHCTVEMVPLIAGVCLSPVCNSVDSSYPVVRGFC
ncbi:HAD hydrolase family protein [Mycobacterium hodleri]|nr:HAD hydrolase family protein [Mycolicibacterium hodleri]